MGWTAYPVPDRQPVITGGSAAQRALLRSILADARPTAVERAWIGRVPLSQDPTRPRGAHWVSIRIRAHDDPNDVRDLPSRAEAQTVTEVFARASQAEHLPAIKGGSLHLRDQTGQVRYASSWNIDPNRRIRGWDASGHSLQAQIASRATASGLTPLSVKTLGDPVRSVELRVGADSPTGLHARISRLARSLQPLRRPTELVGIWGDLTVLEVDGPCHAPVVVTGVTGSWADPRWLCPNPFTIGVSLGALCPQRWQPPC